MTRNSLFLLAESGHVSQHLQGVLNPCIPMYYYFTFLCSGALEEASVDPLICNLISTMIDNKRASHISRVIGAFNTIMAAERGEVSVCGIIEVR